MLKKILITLTVFMFTSASAYAELSNNPWLEENDEEDLKEVYAKQQKRNRNNLADYTAEGETIIDRTSAYIELPDQDEKTEEVEDKGFLDKITDSFSKKEEENTSTPLITKGALSRSSSLSSSDSDDSDNSIMSKLGIDKGINKVKNAIKMPHINTTGMIQKFERASGINLKSIGKQLRRR